MATMVVPRAHGGVPSHRASGGRALEGGVDHVLHHHLEVLEIVLECVVVVMPPRRFHVENLVIET